MPDGFAVNLESVLRWFSTLNETERILAVTTIAQLPQRRRRSSASGSQSSSPGGRGPRAKMEWPPEFPQDAASDPRWLRRWLRNLRLHKYEQSLAGLRPEELMSLGDEDLQRLGIDTVGARNKFLRVLEMARADVEGRVRAMDVAMDVLRDDDSDDYIPRPSSA
jgi:hypothetical protein